MSLIKIIKSSLSSEGIANFEYANSNLLINAKELTNNVWEVYKITFEKNNSQIKKFKPYAEKAVKQLNDSTNPVGKDWKILECDEENYAVLVSGISTQTPEDYKAYNLLIKKEGLVFQQYGYQKGIKMPWRWDEPAILFSDHLEALLNSLLRI